MLFEDTHACELVNQHCQPILDISQPIGQDVVLSGCCKCIHEHIHVRGKRILIHLRNGGKTLDGEEEDGSSPGYLPVLLSIDLNICISLFGNL